MDLCNYHSHCSFCDGRAPMEDFVQAAVAAGFHSYGISSHAPLPFASPCAMTGEAVEVYLAEIARLKRKYEGQIELYAGMEMDYLDEAYGPALAYFQRMPLDYRIGSVHYVKEPETGQWMDMDGPFEVFQENLQHIFEGDLGRLVKTYFAVSTRMVELGGFDFVAHPDKIVMNGSLHDPELPEREWFQRLVKDLLALIAEKGLMVEVNTKAYGRRGMFFPDKRYFRYLKDLKLPVLVNSDAHYPALINEGRAEAFAALRAVGIRHTMRLSRGRWMEVEIN